MAKLAKDGFKAKQLKLKFKNYHSMSPKEIFIFSTIFVTLFGLGLYLSIMTFAGTAKLSNALAEVYKSAPSKQVVSKCSDSPAVSNLANLQNAYLNQLNIYQRICGSSAATKMMIFTDLITNEDQISNRLNSLAENLRDFKVAGITPVIVIEPSDLGQLIDFQEIASGKFNNLFDKYFSTLKSKGITDEQMGIWVPFPEPNVPNWKSQGSTPNDFSLMVNNYGSALKKYFPKAKMSILLNSFSYQPEDKEWANGLPTEFNEYIRSIKSELIESFGVQGFPWVSKANQDRVENFDANDFLQPDLAVRAAKLLRVKEIWFNTGTFSTKYTRDPNNRVNISPTVRMQINNSIYKVTTNIQDQTYKVWVNQFVQDKSATTEATNWSYLTNRMHQKVFKNFTKNLNDAGIEVGLFDIKR